MAGAQSSSKERLTMRERKTFTRREIKEEIKPKLDWAISRGDYEAFKEILTLAEIAPGSDLYRSLEAQFWRAVSERRKDRKKSL
jgi:hypothetical protein